MKWILIVAGLGLLWPGETHRQVEYFCPQSEDHTILTLPATESHECDKDHCTMTLNIDIHGCWHD